MNDKDILTNLLYNYLKNSYGILKIKENDYLVKDLGLDSLNLVDLSIYLYDTFHVTIDLRNDITIGEVINCLRGR